MRRSTRLFQNALRPSRRTTIGRRNHLELFRLEDRAVPAIISGAVYRDANFNSMFDAGEVGVAGQKVFIDLNGNNTYDAPTFLNSGAGSVGVVPDSDPAGIDLALITAGYTGPLTGLKVNFDATMTWDSDIVAELTAPNGTKITLFANVGGAGDNFSGTIFDDYATTPITAGLAPFTGSFQPAPGTLATFNGLTGTDLNGNWTLHLVDVAGGDIMTVNSWSLDIGTGGDIATSTDSAGNYAFNNLANGNYDVRLDLPAGYFVTAPASGEYNVVISGADVTGRDFGRLEANSIQGRVFEDVNNNGTFEAGDVALSGRTVFLDTNANNKLDGILGFTSTDVPKAIPDNDLAGIQSNITVPTGSGNVFDINVTLNISHTWVGDLTIQLIGPDLTTVTLYANSADPDGTNMVVTFDDEAPMIIPNTPPNPGPTPPAYSGAFQPMNPLNVFDGKLAEGTWSLFASDSVGQDIGTINSWSINIATAAVPEISTTTAADGTYIFQGLTPGSYSVAELTPAGWNRLSPAGQHAATVLANSAVVGKNFTEALQGTIYGKTYNDVDFSGTLNAGDTDLAGVQVYVDSNGNNVFDSGTSVNSGPGAPGVVPDGNLAGIDLTLIASGYTGFVTDINVNFDATMTWDSDITATLISPSGKSVTLFSGVGGSGDNFTNTVLDDQASKSITVGAAPFTGSFQPAPGKLSTFNGLTGADVNGTWTLHLVDSVGSDQMTVNSWSLDIATGEASTNSNADGIYRLSGLPAGTYDIRRVEPTGLISNNDPVGGEYTVTLAANGNSFNRNFGQIPDPRPVAEGSGGKVGAPGTSHTVTVVYTDNFNTVIDVSSIGLDDIRIKAPNGTFLLPTAFTPTPNSDSITLSVDYTFPALGGTWDNTDNGIYSIEVIGGKVFDKDTITTVLGTGPYAVQAGKVGQFIVGLDTSYKVGDPSSLDDNDTSTTAKTSLIEALRLAGTDFGNTTITYDPSVTASTVTLTGEVKVNEDLTIIGPTTKASDLVINAAAGNRLFNVDIDGSFAVFANLTMTGGMTTGDGGAILAEDEDITLNNVVVTSNTANFGSAITFTGTGGSLTLNKTTIDSNNATAGGTIFFRGSTHLEMQNSTLSGNIAAQYPGIVFFYTSGGNNSMNIGNSTITNNVGNAFSGGGLYFQGPVGAKGATISNSEITNNKNNFGGGIGLFGMFGSEVTITNTRIENNTANFSGGGIIWAGSGKLNLVDSTLSGNKAANVGGGLYSTYYTDVNVQHSTISGNEAGGSGGGLFFNYGGSLVMDRSTVSGNKSNTTVISANGGGGGIYFYGNPNANGFKVTNSTISSNTTNSAGGAFDSAGGGVLLRNFGNVYTPADAIFESTTITGNNAGTAAGDGIARVTGIGTMTMNNTIVAQNGDALTSIVDLSFDTATNVAGNFNLIGVADTGNFTLTGTNNLTGSTATPLDAKLGPLALNGAPVGSPMTHRPLAGSPVIDAGSKGAGLTVDQRGGLRTVDLPSVPNTNGSTDGTDIGAVEIQLAPTVVSVLTNGVASGQHSKVTSLVINFDQVVTIASPSTAFTIFRTFNSTGGDTATGTVGYTVSGLDANNQGSSVTLTFNGTGSLGALDPGASLRDGKYDVTVNASGVVGLDANMTVNNVSKTWRLFGDINGDGAVTAVDFAQFRGVFGLSMITSPFDFNNDSSVTAADFAQFRARFGLSGFNMP